MKMFHTHERERERLQAALNITTCWQVFKDAKKKHKSLAVCWLDLANAYGSANHSLILYSLRHYHAPPQFLKLIQAFYSNLSTMITSSKWHTP